MHYAFVKDKHAPVRVSLPHAKKKHFLFLLCITWAVAAPQLAARDLQEILASGYINVGVRLSPTIYSQTPDGSAEGLCWKLAEAYAKSLDIEARPILIKTAQDYWQYEENASPQSDPIAYGQVDIAADVFTMTAIRAKQVNMMPFLDITEIFVSRKGSEIVKPSDLLGKSLIVTENQSSYDTAKQFVKTNNLSSTETRFEIRVDSKGIYSLFFPKPRGAKNRSAVEILVLTGDTRNIRSSAVYELLAESKVDAAISNSLTLASYSRAFASMRRLFSLGPVATQEMSQLYFGIPLSAPDLSTSFAGFLWQSRKDGSFSTILQSAIGLSLSEYNSLLNQH